jgi:hypothetical protein
MPTWTNQRGLDSKQAYQFREESAWTNVPSAAGSTWSTTPPLTNSSRS